MADAVSAHTIYQGQHSRKIVRHLTSLSDGTGEADVVKIDVSAFNVRNHAGVAVPASSCVIDKIVYSVTGMVVILEWDATTDDMIARLQGEGVLDFTKEGGKHDPHTTGTTGDVLLTTSGHTAGDSYDITIYGRLR